MLSRRQINVQRDNLISMCRISVKALLDYACLNTQVDDDCEEFINFCAVFEHLVLHRLRPNQKKAWLPRPGPPTPRHFWDVLLDAQSRAHSLYFQSCVPNIDAIESFKSPQAKLRAFVRVALMEKRLSDYIMWILDHQIVLKNHYLEGAVMLSEQASVLCGDLIGLNAIDFNFCLKGNENEFLGPLEISYSGFLRYKQSAASRNSDEIEMLRLNQPVEDEDIMEEYGVTQRPGGVMQAGSVLTESNVNDILRLQQLERDFRSIKEQKDYLEELARLRERQVSETNARLENLKAEQAAQEQEWERERHTMDSCILELQADITKLFQQNERLRFQVASYRQFKDRLGERESQSDEIGMTSRNQEQETSGKVLSVPTSSAQQQTKSIATHKREGSQLSSDLRSLQSTGSDSIKLLDDSHSLVPLTGSLVGDDGSVQDTGAKDAVRKHMSQWETDEDSEDAVPAGTMPVPTINNTGSRVRSVSDERQQHRDLQQQQQQQIATSQPDTAETIMMESFVMTENRSEIEIAVRQALETHGRAEDIVAVQVDVTKDASGDDDEEDEAVGVSAGNVAGKAGDGDGRAIDHSLGEEDGDVVKDGGEDEYDDIVTEEGGEETKNERKTVGTPQPGLSGAPAGKDSDSTPEPDQENSTPDARQMVTSDPEEQVVTSDPEELVVSSSETDELAVTSDPEELVVTSDQEEMIVTSEPEILDNGNTSSDGSDVAWDMVPDSEQAEAGEGDPEENPDSPE